MHPFQHKVFLLKLKGTLLTLVSSFYDDFFLGLCRTCASLENHPLLIMIFTMGGGAKHVQNAQKYSLAPHTTSDALNMAPTFAPIPRWKISTHNLLFHIETFFKEDHIQL